MSPRVAHFAMRAWIYATVLLWCLLWALLVGAVLEACGLPPRGVGVLMGMTLVLARGWYSDILAAADRYKS